MSLPRRADPRQIRCLTPARVSDTGRIREALSPVPRCQTHVRRSVSCRAVRRGSSLRRGRRVLSRLAAGACLDGDIVASVDDTTLDRDDRSPTGERAGGGRTCSAVDAQNDPDRASGDTARAVAGQFVTLELVRSDLRRVGCPDPGRSTAASPEPPASTPSTRRLGQAWVSQDSAVLGDEALKTWYDQGPSKSGVACVQHILVAERSEAQAVLDRLDAGEAFGDVGRLDVARHESGAQGGSTRVPAAVQLHPVVRPGIRRWITGRRGRRADTAGRVAIRPARDPHHSVRRAQQRRRDPRPPDRARSAGTTSRPTPRSAPGAGSTSRRSGERIRVKPVSSLPRVVVVGLGPGGRRARDGRDARRDRAHPAPLPAHVAPPQRPSRARSGHVRRRLRGRPTRFADVYAEIADRLVAAAAEHGEVLYAVPGSPLVLERSVRALARRRSRSSATVLPAMSFLDVAWARLGIDPVEAGVRLIDGHEFADRGGRASRRRCWSPTPTPTGCCRDIKLAVEDATAATSTVVILQRLGTPDEAIVHTTWAELDRTVEADHLTCVYIPSLGDAGRRRVRALPPARPHAARAVPVGQRADPPLAACRT